MRKNDHKTVHKTYINTLGVPLAHCHTAMDIFLWQSDCESLSTSPLFALFTCCWMSFEAVLGNKEFEFVVSEVTLTVVTRVSTSGRYGVSAVLVSVTGSGSDSLETQTVSLALLPSSTSLPSGSKNFFLIQRIQVSCTRFHHYW